MKFTTFTCDEKAKLYIENIKDDNGIVLADVHLVQGELRVPQMLYVEFCKPSIDCYSVWFSSKSGEMRSLLPDWNSKKNLSSAATGMPLYCAVSRGGDNRICVAVSDAKSPIQLEMGVTEREAEIKCRISFFVKPTTAISEYTATIRIDLRSIPFYDSVKDVVRWWENECGYAPAFIPESSRDAVNSLWYSFHQDLDEDEIVRQCKMSKMLGMDTVIVDDGWQTDNIDGGYAYCGDWEVCSSKINDMKRLVERVHETGTKFMLWYSMPFVGKYSKAYEKFMGMFLTNNAATDEWCSGWESLDPRYKEVRNYLVNTYKKAVESWGIDGLKLDFIDMFILQNDSPSPNEKMDFNSVEDAVDALMNEVSTTLKKINPDIMLEFRQAYVGPMIKKYGNMLRVHDCPNDALMNWSGMLDLRLTSGIVPVHSDMIMWHYDEPVEQAALQIANILYCVPQISVKFDKLPKSHYEMLKYYLAFYKKYRNILLGGELSVSSPERYYTYAKACKNDTAIITLQESIVVEKSEKTTIIVNASASCELYVKNFGGCSYHTVDCMGNTLNDGEIPDNSVTEISVPMCGMIYIE